MKRYQINLIGWNSAHPLTRHIGHVWAANEADARLSAYRKWPCGNGQEYRATLTDDLCPGGLPCGVSQGCPYDQLQCREALA